MRCRRCIKARSRGAAAVEFALVSPLLAFLFLAGTDFARAYHASVVVNHCAFNGAAYACLSTYDSASPYASLQQAALADAGNLSPTPSVSSTTGTDSNGSYVEVTVSHNFSTFGYLPGISNPYPIARTVRMRKNPDSPS
jgi:Flp pilus assembly protein TadG